MSELPEDDEERPTTSPSPFEERLLAPRPREPEPTFPLLSGVYTFPWYPRALKAWIVLSLVALVVGFCWHMLIQLMPVR